MSYNRPLAEGVGDNSFFNAEYPMIRWMERNGYDMSYVGGADVDRSAPTLLQHKVFMSAGHDEYWSGQQRANVEAARDSGVSLAFFSGNEVFWKTRWENSIDASGAPYRTLVSYKETHANAKIDPSPQWTGTWMDPRFSPPSDGGRPQNQLTGTLFSVSGPRDDAITVPAADGKLRFWRNTSVASMSSGQTATLTEGTLGMEWDADTDNGFRPAGLVDMSHTTVDIPNGLYVLQDYGNTFTGGTATHSLTLYKAASGALVFSAGSVQWSWGLDDHHLQITGVGAIDPRIQQATVNLFADMAAQPATLQSGLTAATKSTDTTAPTTAITAPVVNASVQIGVPTTISGTATDTGGGVVAGVEVSTDNGTTWHPAQGRENWTYSWTPATNGSTTIKVRATDDSANLQGSPASLAVTVAWACPCNIFPPSATPAGQSVDTTPLELGVRFRPQVNGLVTGVRFYKAAGNTGVHTGSLWSASGQLLATATFTSETATGWQQVLFSNPVSVTANTTYVASYYAPTGSYSYTSAQFANAGITTAPLTALQDGFDGGNGAFRYGAGGFPSDSYGATNYWVDVVFSDQVPPDNAAPTITGRTPAAGSTGVSVNDPVVVSFSEPMVQGTLSVTLKNPSNVAVPATSLYSTTFDTLVLTPNAPLTAGATYTVTVTGTDLAGNALQNSPVTWSFTTGGVGTCPCRIFSSAATPATLAANDSNSVELGVKFRADVNGYVNGVRFYKGAGNTGTHTGSLWSASGQLLATATFTGETANGWQQVLFSSPVAVTANTTYVVSYYAPNGHYAYTANGFGAAVDNPPLHALASGAAGGNGVYRYGSSGYPTDSFGAANYWVDVVLGTTQPADTTAPTIVSATPAGGSTGVSVTDPVKVTFSEAMVQSSVSFTLTGPASALIPATMTYDGNSNTATLAPNAPLAAGTTYTVTVNGSDAANNLLAGAPVSWTFTTGGLSTCPCRIFSSSATPQGAAATDSTPTEVGVKIRTDVSGWINGVRFYKGAGNVGTHIGTLWSASGQKLATVTFANETAGGWQETLFSNPVAVSANTTYVVSYFAPNGHYAYTSNQFGLGAVDNAPLHALASGGDGPNGVFRSGASGFPGDSFGNTNYWVDVVFSTAAPADTTPPSVVTATPAAGSAHVSVTDPVKVTFSEAMAPASVSVTLAGPGNTPVPAAQSYDGNTKTVTLTPTSPLADATTYTVTVNGADQDGNALTGAPATWTFTTGGLSTCPCTIFSTTATPQGAEVTDGTPIEVGVKFRTDVDGYVDGVRFYKGADNTGAHAGNLWSSSGQLLASVTFANESASGWQQAAFSQPVAVNANTTYVVSYFAPNGHYAYTSNQFGLGAVDNAPLHALASGADGANGVYRYGSAGFPTDSFGNTNYWIDVEFSTQQPGVQQPQTITFAPLAAVNYGSAPRTVSATGGGSGNPVLVTSSTPGVCTTGGTNGSMVTIIGAGSCSVTASQAGSLSYAAATPVTQSFVVNPVSLTVTAAAATKVYGQSNPALVANFAGFVPGDNLGNSGVTGSPDCTSSATPSSAVGSYPITCTAGTLAAQNYTFSYVPGSLAVSAAPLTVTAISVTKTLGDANPTLGATITGFVLGQTQGTSGVTGAPACTTTATTNGAIGSYPVTCTVGTLVAVNYSFASFVAGTLTVAAPQVAFTTAAQTQLTTGLTSGTITVQRQNADGSPRTTGGSMTVNLSTSPANGVFRNTADSATITSVTIAAGASGASFRYRPSSAGTPTVTAAANGFTAGTQVETVQNPTLVFTTTAQTIARNTTSGNITVQRRAADGTPMTTGTITVNLATSPANGTFRDQFNLFNITSVTIGSGASTVTFRYRPSAAGTPMLSASSSGYQAATQVWTIT